MPLTDEQARSLDELMALAPSQKSDRPAATPDLLKTWLGVSQDELSGSLKKILGQKDHWEDQLRSWVDANPLDAAFEFLAASAMAFYLAEKDTNPKIKTYIDAFYYIATSASVGYADIFAITQVGKAIASLVMVVGPSLAANALDHPSQKPSA